VVGSHKERIPADWGSVFMRLKGDNMTLTVDTTIGSTMFPPVHGTGAFGETLSSKQFAEQLLQQQDKHKKEFVEILAVQVATLIDKVSRLEEQGRIDSDILKTLQERMSR